MDLLTMTVMGDPVPKGRPRAGGGHHYTPKRTRAAEDGLRSALGIFTDEPYAGDVGVELIFYCATRRRTDGDNLTKLVTDALQRGRREDGGVILDDSQILDWHIRVHRRADGQEPRTQIRVYTL